MPPTKELPKLQQTDPTASPAKPAPEDTADFNGYQRGPLVAAILVLLVASTVVMVLVPFSMGTSSIRFWIV